MSRLKIAARTFVASLVILFVAACRAVEGMFEGMDAIVMLPFRIFGVWLPAPKMQPDPFFEVLEPILFFAPPLIAINCFWWVVRECAKKYNARVS